MIAGTVAACWRKRMAQHVNSLTTLVAPIVVSARGAQSSSHRGATGRPASGLVDRRRCGRHCRGRGDQSRRIRSRAALYARVGSPRHLSFTDGGRELFDCAAQCFELVERYPQISAAEIVDCTGFEIRHAPKITTTLPPTPHELALLRGVIRAELREAYPQFAGKAFKAA